MNEVTKVHLGREAFTISIDAHKALKAYLEAIKKQVKDVEVINEVELRMAELLRERGINDDKVILSQDIDFLKQQLGQPEDFSDDNDGTESSNTDESSTKKLFRDTDEGIIAGVCAGIAVYFGLDVWLVRILFVISTIAWGWGILVYIILLLVVPEAKTSSDKLRMRGKPVNLDNIIEAVDTATISNNVAKAGTSVARVANNVFKVLLKITGLAFILAALAGIFALISTVVYIAQHDGRLFMEGFFPIGKSEVGLMVIVFVLLALFALMILITGLAMFRRKWPIPAWATGVIAGMFFVGLAVSIALGADAAPRVQDRFEAAQTTETRAFKSFGDINYVGEVGYHYEYGDKYAVYISYIGNSDASQVNTSVEKNVLKIDSSEFENNSHCNMLCLFPDRNLEITVYSPDYPKNMKTDDYEYKIKPEISNPNY